MGNVRKTKGQAVLAAVVLAATIVAAPAAAAPDWWRPAAGISWEIQLNSSPNPETLRDVDAYDVDLFETPNGVLDAIEAQDSYTICYFSAGSYEAWRTDAAELRDFRGEPLKGWKGEWWIDINEQAVRDVMVDRLDLAADKGCDAVDPDNVDAYANRNGLGLTEAEQLDYLRFLSQEAHARGLAIGLKNAVDLVPELVDEFDFAVNEECFDYKECGTLEPFIEANKPVLQIQYGGKKHARKICATANGLGFSTLVKRLDLGATGIACRR